MLGVGVPIQLLKDECGVSNFISALYGGVWIFCACSTFFRMNFMLTYQAVCEYIMNILFKFYFVNLSNILKSEHSLHCRFMDQIWILGVGWHDKVNLRNIFICLTWCYQSCEYKGIKEASFPDHFLAAIKNIPAKHSDMSEYFLLWSIILMNLSTLSKSCF